VARRTIAGHAPLHTLVPANQFLAAGRAQLLEDPAASPSSQSSTVAAFDCTMAGPFNLHVSGGVHLWRSPISASSSAPARYALIVLTSRDAAPHGVGGGPIQQPRLSTARPSGLEQ
jgi:hypothetical protein